LSDVLTITNWCKMWLQQQVTTSWHQQCTAYKPRHEHSWNTILYSSHIRDTDITTLTVLLMLSLIYLDNAGLLLTHSPSTGSFQYQHRRKITKEGLCVNCQLDLGFSLASFSLQHIMQVLTVYMWNCWLAWHLPSPLQALTLSSYCGTGCLFAIIYGGTAAASPPPFRRGNPAVCGSHPLVTPYYCRLGDLMCFVFIVSLLYFFLLIV